MEASKVITYSLLAQIRNSGNFVNSSVEIFVPIVKYALYKLITQSGVYKGASITEISTWICQYFGLDFPPAVLEKILLKIGQEINTSEELKLQVYRDGSFWIKNYSFEEFNDIYETNRQQVELVQTMFKQFCDINDVKKDSYNTIFDFVNLNKLKISNYLANRDYSVNGSKFSIEAQFVEYFRNIPGCYEVIRKIYLGSILSCYLSEYEPQDKMMSDVELLLDTNFIVSLLDLNTPESTTTCRQLLKIASSFGYSLRVLKETIKETTDLLLKKAEYFDKSFLPKLINQEDIYNACERRNLNRNDLERIADNLENILVDEYSILQIPYTVKYQNLAKSSTEYAEFKKIRNTDFAALHDIMALYYVREKRGKKKIKHFEDVNCWFVNNAINHDNSDYVGYKLRGYQPEIIRADELLCVLWFIKPDIGNGDLTDGVVDTNLNALISCTLNSSLPQASIIKELDDNIQKYKDASISDKDILRIATRITTHQLKNIEGFCWNNLLNPNARLLKVKLKGESVNDVGSMSLYTTNILSNKYIVALLNSNILFDYYREFINCSVNVQINDIKQLPIIIPTKSLASSIELWADKAIKKKQESANENLEPIEVEIEDLIKILYSI